MANKTYEERKARGQCTRCPNQALPGRTRCQTCTDIVADYCAGRRDIWELQGKCRSCGKRPPTPGYKSCEKCRSRQPAKNATQPSAGA